MFLLDSSIERSFHHSVSSRVVVVYYNTALPLFTLYCAVSLDNTQGEEEITDNVEFY
jgi:hypothetical protein